MQRPYRGLLARPCQDGAEDASSNQAAEKELINKHIYEKQQQQQIITNHGIKK